MPKPIPEERCFLAALSELLAVTGSKVETSVLDKLHDKSNYVLIRQKPQQLAGKATVPDSVISRF